MYCTAPRLSNSVEFNQSARPLRIGLLMDGVSSLLELNTSLNLQVDPVFTQFSEEMVFTSGEPIVLMIQGEGFEGFVFLPGQIVLLIEPCRSKRGCLCTVTNVFPNNVSDSSYICTCRSILLAVHVISSKLVH